MKSSFLVKDVFEIVGRGLIITGVVLTGIVKKQMKTTVNGKQIEVVGIEAFRKTLDEAKPNDEVGLLVSGKVSKSDFSQTIKMSEQLILN